MYKKIDIYWKRKFVPLGTSAVWQYECSTNMSKTCKEAKKRFCEKYKLDKNHVKCSFAK